MWTDKTAKTSEFEAQSVLLIGSLSVVVRVTIAAMEIMFLSVIRQCKRILVFVRVFLFAQQGNRDPERVLCTGQSM